MGNTKATFAHALPRNLDGLPTVELDSAHSPLKVLAHGETLRRFAADEKIRPIHMRIGITGACNMRCNFCNFHSQNENKFYDQFSYKEAISTSKAIEILEEFALSGGRAVTFCGSGESTIHPGYALICSAAYSAGLRIGLITNGAMLHLEHIAEVLTSTHTWVRVGMNAGSAKTFAAITHHRVETFEKILGAIRGLRERAADPYFRIGLNFVITIDNYLEIETATRRARESGAHYVRFEPEFYSALGHRSIAAVMPEIGAGLRLATRYLTSDFEVSIPKLDRGPMDQTEVIEGDFSRCHYSRFVTAVGADGHLYPCPQVHLNSRYRIGNVVEEGYLKVLEGGLRERWESENPLRTDLCKTCFYRPQNELLQLIHDGRIDLEGTLASYAIEVPRTLHADFI
jgi:radical SAM protein with 4Fe4S-binding SPASM domain